MPNIIKAQPKKVKKTPRTKTAPKITKSTALTKPRPVRSKTNTLAYYNCLIDQVQNPLNEKVKITQLSHHCKCNKGKAQAAREEHKQQLVQQLVHSYQAFGNSLAHYLQADLLGCLKKKPGLKKK